MMQTSGIHVQFIMGHFRLVSDIRMYDKLGMCYLIGLSNWQYLKWLVKAVCSVLNDVLCDPSPVSNIATFYYQQKSMVQILQKHRHDKTVSQ